MVDIIIPLGTGSKNNNDELRLFLRSIEKNGIGYRKIIVVASEIPNWLQNVTTLQMADTLKHNKDGNIIRKVLFALTAVPDITPEFVWSSDDCVLLQEFDFSTVPPIYNARNKERFPVDGSIWQRRIRRTFEFFEKRNLHLKHNFESHVPQRFPGRKLLRAMRNTDYQSDIGYGINTLFHGLLGITGGFEQKLFKVTCESEKVPALDKVLLGYNDKGFATLKKELFRMFPSKSKYER